MDDLKKQPTIAVLVATYNRWLTTKSCLDSLSPAIDGRAGFVVFLVDGGSTDGTFENLSAYEFVHAEQHAGLFWNQAMRKAWSLAQSAKPDFFLLLNDDTLLEPRSIAGLLEQRLALRQPTVLVGRVQETDSRATAYGAYRRQGSLSRLSFRHLREEEHFGDTFNANCVLVDASTVARIGNLSERFSHSMGDIDYGLRCSAAGIPIVEHKPPVAFGARNTTWEARNSRLSLKNWREILRDPKGIPWREWWYFCRTHGGPLGPVNFIYRYLKILRP